MKKFGLLPRLVLGIVSGIIVGKLGIPILVRLVATFNGIFGNFLGFGPEIQALMIALYLAQDSFGTACNVTGDGAIAVLVNKIAGFTLDK